MIKEKQLELLGLSDKEARLYVAALPLGPFTVAEISQKSGLKRPTCYIVLDELTKRGLVSMIPRAKKRLYKVESPEAFIRQARNVLNYAEKIVPTLSTLIRSGDEAPQIKFYYGQKGIQNIFDDSIVNNKEKMLYHIGSIKTQVEMVGEDFLKDYIKRRVAKGIRSISVRMRGTEVEEYLYQGQEKLLREIRFAPKDIFIPDTILVHGHKVVIVSTVKGNFGFVLDSQEFTETILGLFQALWRISTVK